MQIRLSKRLAAAAKMAEELSCVYPDRGEEGIAFADIGCDHAYLAIALISRGIASFAVASDVKEGPLQRARANAARFGVADRMRFVCADGLAGLQKNEASLAAICGMGGDVMIKILTDTDPQACGIERLILSPHTKAELVRAFLSERAYRLVDETFVYEDGKYYPVLGVDLAPSPSGTDAGDVYLPATETVLSLTPLTEKEAFDLLYRFGPVLLMQSDETLRQYLEERSAQLRRLIAGLHDDTIDADRERLTYEMRLTDAALACVNA